jgi:competence protein ComEA
VTRRPPPLRTLLRWIVDPGPPGPRDRRATYAVDLALAVGILLSIVSAVAERARRRSGDAQSAEGDPASSPTSWQSLPVDVGKDPPWQLRLLPGIGPARAEAIVEDRRTHGPISSVHDLTRVRGLGPKIVEALVHAGAVAGEALREEVRGPARGALGAVDALADGTREAVPP